MSASETMGSFVEGGRALVAGATTTAVTRGVSAAPAGEAAARTAAQARLGVRTALTAMAILGTMVAIGFATGVAQEPMQWVAAGADYARVLAQRPAVFRTVVGLDNAFIAFYAATFVLVHGWLRARGAPRALAAFALACLLATAGLDLVENMHYLVLSRRVEGGFGVVEGLAQLQVWLSWLKFHVSYIGLVALGLAFPRRTLAERALAASLVWLQLGLGLAIYVLPHALAVPLVLARAFFFLAGLGGTAWVLWADASADGGARAAG